eukprot:1143759-Pelagomonas_calceolata.AAC.1
MSHGGMCTLKLRSGLVAATSFVASAKLPSEAACEHDLPRAFTHTRPQQTYVYHEDEYTLLDGDKRANMQPSFG